MAKQIIVLEVTNNGNGTRSVRSVFWFPVATNKVPRPTMTASAFPGANASEITSLQSGATLEETNTFTFPDTLDDNTLAARLQEFFTARSLNLGVNTNPIGKYYGNYWDGTSWTIVPH